MATQIPTKKTPETHTGELSRPFTTLEEMQEMAERMFPMGWMRPLHLERMFWGAALPQIDILDREAELIVYAAVPGFGKNDIEVTTSKDAVTLRGQLRREAKEGGEYYRHEIECRDFLRTIHLPCLVDDTKAKATFKDGMLELVLPKTEGAKRHTVKIEEQ